MSISQQKGRQICFIAKLLTKCLVQSLFFTELSLDY